MDSYLVINTVDVYDDGCMIVSNHISSLAIMLLMYAVIAARLFSKQYGYG